MPEKSDIAQLIGSIAGDAQRIVQGEAALAKQALKPAGTKLALDSVLAVGALILVLLATVVIPLLAASGLAWAVHGIFGLSPWACVFLGAILALILFLLLAGLLAWLFVRRIKAHGQELKDGIATVALNTRQAFGAFQSGIAQGQELVEATGHKD